MIQQQYKVTSVVSITANKNKTVKRQRATAKAGLVRIVNSKKDQKISASSRDKGKESVIIIAISEAAGSRLRVNDQVAV